MRTVATSLSIPIWVLLWIAITSEISCNYFSTRESAMIYREIQAFNDSCYPLHVCGGDSGMYFENCKCDNSCDKYDDCCLNSEFRNTGPKYNWEYNYKCIPVYGDAFRDVLMVESCRNGDVDMEHLCRSNAEESNDPLLMVPVTSTVSGITYKNYFCSICNEDLDESQITFWNVYIEKESGNFEENSPVPDLRYDPRIKSWTTDDNKNGNFSIPTKITIEIPKNVVVRRCRQMIATCAPNWRDPVTVAKCKAYMAVIFTETNGNILRYRNPHCALCNFVSMSELKCKEIDKLKIFYVHTFFVNLFVLEGKEKKCGLNMVYDRFAKKCRCNSRNFLMKDGQCVKKA